MLSDALEFLKSAESQNFDFVFADATPGKYEGLEDCLRTVKRGGFYVVDDMLPQENWPEGHAAKIPLLLEALARHEEFAMVSIAWSSGIAVAVRC